MKINLELNIPDNRIFLNFWNWYNGDDVVCQIKNDKLFLNEHINDEIVEREITLIEFVEMVSVRMNEMKNGRTNNT